MSTDSPDSECSFVDEIDHLVKKVLWYGEFSAKARSDARAAIVEYYGQPERNCTTPEDAADEILGAVSYDHGRAGFLLGFAVALRLQAAVAGGAR
jgi:hypothetical protein